jgi:hypothetical protein
LNGYYKSEETYYNNNRIKEIEVEFMSNSGEVMLSERRTFDDKPYQALNFLNFYKATDSAFSIEYEYFESLNEDGENIIDWAPGKIRITILDVYSGKKYDNTCISEIFVIQE